MKYLLTIYFSIFLAELADKTQLATLSFALNSPNKKLLTFIGSSLALITSSAIAIFFGHMIQEWMNPKYIRYFSGTLFIVIGILILVKP